MSRPTTENAAIFSQIAAFLEDIQPQQLLLYTDGSYTCATQGGVGIVVRPYCKPIACGVGIPLDAVASSEEAELRAIWFGLSWLPDGTKVRIFSDSREVVRKLRTATPRLTCPFAADLLAHRDRLQVDFQVIAGHSGHTENTFAHQLALRANRRQEFFWQRWEPGNNRKRVVF